MSEEKDDILKVSGEGKVATLNGVTFTIKENTHPSSVCCGACAFYNHGGECLIRKRYPFALMNCGKGVSGYWEEQLEVDFKVSEDGTIGTLGEDLYLFAPKSEDDLFGCDKCDLRKDSNTNMGCKLHPLKQTRCNLGATGYWKAVGKSKAVTIVDERSEDEKEISNALLG